MISDLSRLAAAIDAVTDPVTDVDLAALDHQVQAFTPEERENVRDALLKHGRATISVNGHAVTLQIRHRPGHNPRV